MTARPWAVVDGDTLDFEFGPVVWARFTSEQRAYQAAEDECPFPSFVVRHMPRSSQ